MNFQTAIQLLCQLTQIKVANLASAINYDRSIVSKWKNGQRLPSRKNYKEIINQLSHCFTQVIVAEQIEEQLKGLCQVKVTLRNANEVRKAVSDILELAYYQSELEFESQGSVDEDFHSFIASSVTEVVTDRGKMTEFCVEQFLNKIAKIEGDVNLYSTVSLTMLVTVLLSSLTHVAYAKNRVVTLHMAIKQSELLGLSEEEFYFFSKLMLTSSYLDIRVYVYQNENPDDFFYIAGDCIGWVVTTKSGMPSLIYSNSKQLGEHLFEQNRSVFDEVNNLVDTGEDTRDENSLLPIIPNSKKYLLTGYICDFLVPETILTYIDEHEENQVDSQVKQILDRMYSRWEDRVFQQDIYLVIPRIALIHFIRTGHVQVDGRIMTIPISYRVYMLKKFWKNILLKKQFHFYIIDDEEQNSLGQINVSILIADGIAIYSKDLENTRVQSYQKHAIKQHDLLKDLYEEMESFFKIFEGQEVSAKDFGKIPELVEFLAEFSSIDLDGISTFFSHHLNKKLS